MTNRSLPSSVCVIGLLCITGCAGVQVQSQPLKRAAEPLAGGESIYNIRDFGAVGDGQTLNTAAIAKAVHACARAGGGTVLIPSGRYLTGAIELSSHVRLHLDTGAILLASRNADDYPLVEFPWQQGRQWLSSLIYAHDAKDIAITGRGVIEGQGESWWAPIKAEKIARKAGRLGARTAEESQNSQIEDASPGLPRGRVQIIRLVRCNSVLIDGITIRNAPQWNIHPMFCENVRIANVSIFAPADSPNTDGINPESCKGVQILNCLVDTGDDCITLKSGLNELGRRMGKPCEDVLIANCALYRGHGGVTIGSEMSGGVRNIVVTNCTFNGTDIAVRIKSQRGRGGTVENIVLNGLVISKCPRPFVITSFYMGKDKPEDQVAVDETTPRIRRILISNVLCTEASDAGGITGLKEMPISDIVFSNVNIEARKGFTLTNATGIRFSDCAISVRTGEPLTQNNSTDIDVSRLRTSRAAE